MLGTGSDATFGYSCKDLETADDVMRVLTSPIWAKRACDVSKDLESIGFFLFGDRGGGSSNRKEEYRLLSDRGVSGILVGLMNQFSDDISIQRQCLVVLMRLWHHNVESSSLLVRSGSFERAMRAVESFLIVDREGDWLLSAFDFIHAILYDSTLNELKLFVDLGGPTAIARAMKRYPENSRVQLKAIEIAHLVGIPCDVYRMQLVDAGVAPLVAQAATSHRENKDIQMAARGAIVVLMNISSDDMEGMDSCTRSPDPSTIFMNRRGGRTGPSTEK